MFSGGTLAVGFAAVNTGNNLLYLLMGAMLGFIALSSWLSEKTIQALDIRRRVPRGVPVGKTVRITYHVTNRKPNLPTMAAHLTEKGLAHSAFIGMLMPGEDGTYRSENEFVKRGVYPLGLLTLTTSFPFGMFKKERDVTLPGELVIWPRSDRPVRLPSSPGGRVRPKQTVAMVGAAGARGEFRGLREYRAGDDPRDIHWRSSARRGEPVVKEYDVDAGEALWLCLDTRLEPGERAEGAVETVASMAARASAEGRRFALATPKYSVDPGSGAGHLERVLDVLARVDFDPAGPMVSPPSDPRQCVLVTPRAATPGPFGSVIEPGVWKDPKEASGVDRPRSRKKGWFGR